MELPILGLDPVDTASKYSDHQAGKATVVGAEEFKRGWLQSFSSSRQVFSRT